MRLYLDDDSADRLLAQLLWNAGHDVRLPAEIGLSGSHDAVHLMHAIQEGRVILSRNHDDFEELHDLVLEAQGHHPGVLIVRRDNNPKRDLKAKGIARAVAKLEAAQVAVSDQFLILNAWR